MADQATIRALVRSEHLNPVGLHWSRFLVVVDGADAVVGTAQLKGHRDGSRELASLVVREPWRGQGVAGELIRALQETHGPPLYLMCASSLAPFYTRFGFDVAEQDALPTYFRRMARLARWAQRLRPRIGLTIMVWSRQVPGMRER